MRLRGDGAGGKAQNCPNDAVARVGSGAPAGFQVGVRDRRLAGSTTRGKVASMRTLRLYVLRLHLVPWLLGFGVVTYLLQLDFLVDIMDLLVARGIPIRAVGELFLLSMAWMVALSVPCGVLVSSLMTFGRMAQDNEITALKASGINVFRVLLAPLAGAFVLFLGLCAFNGWVLPESNHRLASL